MAAAKNLISYIFHPTLQNNYSAKLVELLVYDLCFADSITCSKVFTLIYKLKKVEFHLYDTDYNFFVKASVILINVMIFIEIVNNLREFITFASVNSRLVPLL